MGMLKKRLHAVAAVFLPVALTLGLHGVWALMPLDPLPSRSHPTVAALTAYPNPGSQSWSPVLFSLPSPSGFSSVTRGDPVSILPPLQSPLDLSSRMPFPVTTWFPEKKLPPLRISESTNALTPSAPLQPSPPTSTGFRWVLRVLEEEGGGRLQSQRLPRLPPAPRALHLEGVIHFDRYGQVAHLLLDPPGAPEGQRLEIIQSLLHLRIWPESAPDRLRFRLSLEPR